MSGRAPASRSSRLGGDPDRVKSPAASIVIATLFTGLLCAQKPAVEQAWHLLAQDKRTEAAELLRAAIRKHPTDADALLLLGSILAEAGQTGEAIPLLREGVRLRPKAAIAHNALGEALKAAGDTSAARDAFRKAVELDPRFAQARENLGRTLLQSGDLAGAAAQLDRAIQLLGETETAADARYLRARVHTQSGEFKQAEIELRRAVELRPAFAEAWSDLGQARESLGDDTGALAALERAVQINPDGPVAQTRLGSLYLQLGKPREAVHHLERAARLSPDNQTALNSLQLALREMGETQRADQVKSQLAEIFRNRDRASQNALSAVKLNNEGAELEKKGALAAAAEKYRAALKLNAGHAGIRANYAVALLRLGQWEQGLEELRTAVRQDPSNQTFKQALEDALAQAPASFRKAK
jgi:Flp pilus assembly protein TadD